MYVVKLKEKAICIRGLWKMNLNLRQEMLPKPISTLNFEMGSKPI